MLCATININRSGATLISYINLKAEKGEVRDTTFEIYLISCYYFRPQLFIKRQRMYDIDDLEICCQDYNSEQLFPHICYHRLASI